MVGFRGADMFSPDRYALELIDEASSDLGSRFFVRIREEMGLAYYVGASQMQGLVPGPFTFYLGTDPEKLDLVKAALLDEIGKLADSGLTSEELTRAKKKLIGQQRIANQSNDSFGYMAALDELYGLGFDHFKKLEAGDRKDHARGHPDEWPQNISSNLMSSPLSVPPQKFDYRSIEPTQPAHILWPKSKLLTQSGELTQRFIEFVMMQAQNAALFLGKSPIRRPVRRR